jgi:uridine phosphorylase
MSHDIPLLEYDDDPDSIINPHRLLQRKDEMPEHVVLCFFADLVQKITENAPLIYAFGGVGGKSTIHRLEYNGQAFAVVYPRTGAPIAARTLDETIAIGGRKFIACGGCGVLDKTLALGDVFIVESAVRDEGVSYHYLPPSREVQGNKAVLQTLETVLQSRQVSHRFVKTWTTDAILRETRAKIVRRKAEGCLTVEMEAAALMAVAQFRNVAFGQLLYAGDDISGTDWDNRDWLNQHTTREKLFWLAVESVLAL